MEEPANKFELAISEDDPTIAYLKLPSYPTGRHGRVKKQIRLVDLLGRYQGSDIYLDFDEDDVLIGIEFL